MKYKTLLIGIVAGWYSTQGMHTLQPATILDIVHHVKTTQPSMAEHTVADTLLFYLQRSNQVLEKTLAQLLSHHAALPIVVHAFKNPNICIQFPSHDPRINTQTRWFELNELIHLLALAKNTCLHPAYNPAVKPCVEGAEYLFSWNCDHVPETTYMICHNSLIIQTPPLSTLLNTLEHEKNCLDEQCTCQDELENILVDNQTNLFNAEPVYSKLITKRQLLKQYCPRFFRTLFGNDNEVASDRIMYETITGYIAQYFHNPHDDIRDTLLHMAQQEPAQENEQDIVLQVASFAHQYTNPYDKDHMIQFIREFLFL